MNTGNAKARMRRVCLLEDPTMVRKRLRKRTKVQEEALGAARPMWAKVAAWVLLTVMVFWVGMVVYSLPGQALNGGLWGVMWVFGFTAYALIAYLCNWIPESHTSRGIMLAAAVMGIIAVPLLVAFLATTNAAVAIVATPFVMTFALLVGHHGRAVMLHREGYSV